GMGAAVLALTAPSAEGISLPWAVPGGALRVRVDGLSAMFFGQIFFISILGAIYGLGYWPQAGHRENGRKLRLFYGLLTAGIGFLLIARNSVLLLLGWGVLALAAFLTAP